MVRNVCPATARARVGFAAPCPALVREDDPQRVHAPRDLLDGLRLIVRAGCPWRTTPGYPPPWEAARWQARRWARAGAFAAMANDLREAREERGRIAESLAAYPVLAYAARSPRVTEVHDSL